MRFRYLFCLFLCLSGDDVLARYSEENLKVLSENQQWLHLLHYHRVGLFSRFQSQADDPDFFLSETGHIDPHAELLASIKAFQEAGAEENKAPRCRYPARFEWLSQQLGTDHFAEANCPDFDAWFNKIDGGGLTLIFPAAYMNSPSSMYGHTLIRVDRKSGGSSLLDYGVNYAAHADPKDHELVFSYKGLTGGYPGVVTILPYYEKVNEYSSLEARDIWEYTLDVTQEEVDQFLRHSWEIRNTHFDYYFLTENCSYHLLALLDASSKRFDLANEFYERVIPADTVRVVVNNNLITSVTYRPSSMTTLQHQLDYIDPKLRDLAKILTIEDVPILPAIKDLTELQQAQVLEVAYHYSRYLAVRKKQQNPALRKRTVALLSARAKVDTLDVFPPVPIPETRDDEGHATRRLENTWGYDGQDHYLQWGLRMAYHDLLDNAPGYTNGAQLEMFHLKLRHTFGAENRSDKTRLQEARFIDITSLTPRNELLKPISWRVRTGFKRPNVLEDELMAYLNVGFGVTYRLHSQQFYALLDSETNLDDDIDKGYRLAAGPRVGWFTQHESYSLQFEAYGYEDFAGAEFEEFGLSLGAGVAINKDWQMRIGADYFGTYDEEDLSASLSAMRYF